MNHETLEQAAITYASKKIQTRYPKDAAEDFKAGASWREQQAASGFTDYYYHSDIYKHHEDTARAAWIASWLSSAKLLAEKDAEIKKLNFIISFVLFNTRSNYVDKESRELFKKLTKDFKQLFLGINL